MYFLWNVLAFSEDISVLTPLFLLKRQCTSICLETVGSLNINFLSFVLLQLRKMENFLLLFLFLISVQVANKSLLNGKYKECHG